jgi:PII-like signaling protein
MNTETRAKLVTVYVNSSDQWQGRPLYSAIVQLCQERSIAGATVLRCIEGYGGHHQLHTTRLFGLTENLPLRIEIIDVAERIEPLLTELDTMIAGGLVTISDVGIRRYPPEAKA